MDVIGPIKKPRWFITGITVGVVLAVLEDVSSILPKAVEAMTNAQEDLDTEQLREAIPDEQIALRYVQQAEETYERYVTQQQQQPGGGGGSQAAAEDLADLFELELDNLKNQ